MAGVFGRLDMSARDAANAFMELVGDGVPAEELEDFFAQLGRGVGGGLAALLRTSSAVGRLVGAVWNLNALAAAAAVNRPNCVKMSSLGRELLVLLDYAGRRGRQVDAAVLESLAGCADDMASLVDAFCRPGWLLRVLCDVHNRERFTSLHEAALEIINSNGLLTGLGPGRLTLPSADYRDCTRALRRLVRALGNGNLTAGVSSLASSEASVAQVARLLDVSPDSVAAEVQQVPATDLDVDTLFSRLLGGPAGEDLQPLLLESAAMHSLNPELLGGSAVAAAASAATAAAPAGGKKGKDGKVKGGTGKPDAAAAATQGGAGAEGGRGGLYADLFAWYDKNSSGAIEEEELQAALSDLGLLDGKTPAEAAAATASHMRVAEASAAAGAASSGGGSSSPGSGSGGLSLAAFSRWYDTLVMNSARQQLRFKLGLQAEEDLRGVFDMFASFGNRELAGEMDGAHFQKVCRDSGLISRTVTATVADLTFAKVKTKGSRRITFDQFLTALAALADKRGVPFEAVVSKVLEAGGPVARATKADVVRLHDDKSAYTGVHARGGPSSKATTPQFDLAAYLDRSAGDNGTGSTHRAANGTPGSATPKSAGRSSQCQTPLRSSFSCRLALTPEHDTASSGANGRRTSGGSLGVSTPAAMAAAASAVRRSSVGTGGLQRPRRSSSGTGAAGGDDTMGGTPLLFGSKGSAGSLSGPASLKQVFQAFAGFGIHSKPSPGAGAVRSSFDTFTASPASVAAGEPGEMDGFRFNKLCRQAGIVDDSFTTTAADIVFARVKPKGAKKISFAEFRQALQLIAADKGTSYEELCRAVKACGGPALHAAATTPDAVRFYDNMRGSIAAS